MLGQSAHNSVVAYLPGVSNAVKKIGYNLIRFTGELRPRVPEYRHAPVLPVKAQYSPWLTDQAFLNAFQSIQKHSLVDIFRCYELWQLVQQSAKLQSGAIIEVGVWRGGTGCLVAEAALRAGIAEPVYLCDTFEGVVKAGSLDPVYRGGEHKDTTEGIVAKLAQHLNLGSVKILKGTFPEQTAHRISEETIRFAHLDVDVYQSTKDSVAWIWPRLVPGGILVFDDYGTYGCEGVTRVVNELSLSSDSLFVHNLNGHGVLFKR